MFSKFGLCVFFGIMIINTCGQNTDILSCVTEMPYNTTIYYNCCPAIKYGHIQSITYNNSYNHSDNNSDNHNYKLVKHIDFNGIIKDILKFIVFPFCYIKRVIKSFNEQ